MLKRTLIKLGALLVVISGLGIGAAAVIAEKAPGEHHTEEKVVMRPIPTAIAQAVPNADTQLFPGEVRANRRVELAFSVAGLLNRLNAQEGRRVKKGQVIARLDQRDFQSDYDAAKAKCGFAERELQRFDRLLKQNVVSMADYENAKTQYDVAQATMRVKKKALDDTVLHAPFDGLVVTRHMEDHEHVQAKQPVLSLQDISTIEVLIQIPERMIAQEGVEGFDHVLVHFDADTEADRWLEANVSEYRAKSDAVTRTFEVAVALPPPSDLKLYPGMTATVKIQLPTASRSPSTSEGTRVPVEALWRGEDGRSYVWIIPSNGGRPRKQKVEASALVDGNVVIRRGLKPGTRVAVAGVHSLREELPVRPMIEGGEGLDG